MHSSLVLPCISAGKNLYLYLCVLVARDKFHCPSSVYNVQNRFLVVKISFMLIVYAIKALINCCGNQVQDILRDCDSDIYR